MAPSKEVMRSAFPPQTAAKAARTPGSSRHAHKNPDCPTPPPLRMPTPHDPTRLMPSSPHVDASPRFQPPSKPAGARGSAVLASRKSQSSDRSWGRSSPSAGGRKRVWARATGLSLHGRAALRGSRCEHVSTSRMAFARPPVSYPRSPSRRHSRAGLGNRPWWGRHTRSVERGCNPEASAPPRRLA